MLADAQGARVAAHLLGGDPRRRRRRRTSSSATAARAHREGAGPLDERAEAFDDASARAARRRAPCGGRPRTWPVSCGPSVDAIVELRELVEDLRRRTGRLRRRAVRRAVLGDEVGDEPRELRKLSDLTDADLDELYAVAPRPWLRVNMVSTVDGSATGPNGKSGGINNAADKRVFDTLRRLCDCVVVGAGTARDEGYRT